MSHREARDIAVQPARRETRARISAIPVVAALLVLAAATSACMPLSRRAASTSTSSVTVIATSTASAAETQAPSLPSTEATSGYSLVFADEFDGPTIDETRWQRSLPWGNTNRKELEYYTPDAVSQADGVLTITARKAPKGGKTYASGAICTEKRFDFAHGYVELSAQVPKGAGLWSAFWLLRREPGSNDEADVLEVLGSDTRQGHTVLHYGTMARKQTVSSTYQSTDLSVGFHTYALKWEPGLMIWYVDGVERYRATEHIPSEPMILITNLAVGGPTSWSGAPNAKTVFPAEYKIDYVRVWQRK